MATPFSYKNKIKQEKNSFGHQVQDAIFGAFDQIEGAKSGIEIKTDRRATQTGNWFVEYRDNQGKPSGIDTTEAKYWFFVTAGASLFIPTTRLREYIKSLPPKERARKGDGDEGSRGYLLDIKALAAWMWETRGLKDKDAEKPWYPLVQKAGMNLLEWWEFEE